MLYKIKKENNLKLNKISTRGKHLFFNKMKDLMSCIPCDIGEGDGQKVFAGGAGSVEGIGEGICF